MMNKPIDWSFVEEEVADRYSHKGQKAIHPIRMFKLLIIQNLYNLSEREVTEDVDCNTICRYFVGLGLTEDVPHTSDPDAEFGRKESNGQGWYGYKSHTNDGAETELVISAITTAANKTDESRLIPLVDKERDYRGEDAIRKQGGDQGYVGHTDELEKRNILDYTTPSDNMEKAKIKKDNNKHCLHLKKLRYKVEQKFAEVKNRHGLGQARHRGKGRAHLRSLLIYLAVNLKRIANFLIPKMA